MRYISTFKVEQNLIDLYIKDGLFTNKWYISVNKGELKKVNMYMTNDKAFFVYKNVRLVLYDYINGV